MTTNTTKILLVGAGAVGQVYGRHLQLGGAQVTFFVREKYLESLRGGMPVYPLNKQKVTQQPQLFEDYNLVSTAQEVEEGRLTRSGSVFPQMPFVEIGWSPF